MKKTIILSLSFILFIGFLICNDVLAIGLITKPLIVENALRGETIQEGLRILNSEAEETWYKLIAEGEIADWARFYLPEDLENSITEAKGPAESYFNIVVQLAVPADIPNGDYSGKLTVTTKPAAKEEKEGASATVSQQVSRDVSITVTDEENIILAASVIPHTFSLPEDETLKIRIIYDNQGNISLKPQVQVRIKENISKDTIFSVIYPYPENELAVKPSAIYEISALEIPTAGIKTGKYIAELAFLHNDNQILKKDFKFSITDSSLIGKVKGLKIGGYNISWPVIITVIAVLIIIIAGAVILRRRRQTLV